MVVPAGESGSGSPPRPVRAMPGPDPVRVHRGNRRRPGPPATGGAAVPATVPRPHGTAPRPRAPCGAPSGPLLTAALRAHAAPPAGSWTFTLASLPPHPCGRLNGHLARAAAPPRGQVLPHPLRAAGPPPVLPHRPTGRCCRPPCGRLGRPGGGTGGRRPRPPRRAVPSTTRKRAVPYTRDLTAACSSPGQADSTVHPPTRPLPRGLRSAERAAACVRQRHDCPQTEGRELRAARRHDWRRRGRYGPRTAWRHGPRAGRARPGRLGGVRGRR